MAVSLRNIDSAFQGARQKTGLEIWLIENSRPLIVPKESHGKFFIGKSYIILKTTALKSGALRHDIHYWLGEGTSKDEAETAAIKTVELDYALGSRSVQYREEQGCESEKFLSYFRPCIIPQDGGVKQLEAEGYPARLYVCKGKHVVHLKEVPCVRSSLNHEEIFVLDTRSKIFQFNGLNSCIQERAKALEVVQYIKDTYHGGKCEISPIEDGKLMADAQTGEFWSFFGGFAPIPKRTFSDVENSTTPHTTKLLCLENDAKVFLLEPFTRDLLDTNKFYMLDVGTELFVWMGRSTSLDERKKACRAAEDLTSEDDRLKCRIMRIIEGFEPLKFRSKFDTWPQIVDIDVSEQGRSKVAALLKRQGLTKTSPAKKIPQPYYIDVTGNLQVWRVNGNDQILLSESDQFKFYSGDCYIFQYTYSGDLKDECLVGTWFGNKSVEEERVSATLMANKMVEASKLKPTTARLYEGYEPTEFYLIFQTFIVFKGGISSGYKNHIGKNGLQDETYAEDKLAFFRVQGSGPDNMQALQVDPVATSLNSAYCFILHDDTSVYTWSGSLTTSEDQELVERLLDVIKPDSQTKPQKESYESEQFWSTLGGKSEYTNQKIARDAENDPVLLSCSFEESEESLAVKEIHSFTQDDLLTEEIFILDCHSQVFVWVGQLANSKIKTQALTIGERYLERDFFLEKLSRAAPVFVVPQGNEPPFFTRFFDWEAAKSTMTGNSFERKLAIIKNGGTPLAAKPKRKTATHVGRSSVPEKLHRSKSMSFSPDRVRVRGRSPAFNALAANFESPNARNLSTPPPLARKSSPRSASPDSYKLPPKSSSIAALSSSFEKPPPARLAILPRSVKLTPKSSPLEPATKEIVKLGALDIPEDEKRDDASLLIYPYERLVVKSSDPVADLDVTKRESYLSSAEFREKFGMSKDAFYEMPKWKQNKLKMALFLF